MQSRDNPYEDADVLFIRNQVRLAHELAKRHVEFAVVPLVTRGEAEAKMLVSISKHLNNNFLPKQGETTTDDNAASDGRE